MLVLLAADSGWTRGTFAPVAFTPVAFAKEIDVTGTVDCGRPSGKRCDIGDTLVLLTSDVTGELAPATIDITWIKDKLPGLDQDDEITLSVEVRPNGKLQALSVILAKKRSGTVNQGKATGTNEHARARRTGEDDDDHDNTGAAPGGGGIVVPPPGQGALAGTVRSV